MKTRILGLVALFYFMIFIASAQTSTYKPIPQKKTKDNTVKNQQSVIESNNHPGWNEEIRYIDQHHTHWIAKAKQNPGNIIITGDPTWAASSDNRKTWVFVDWITIVDDQGGLWQSKMHAITSNGKIYLHLENKHVGESNGKDGPIDILDWQGKKWQIAGVGLLPDHIVKFNLVPKF